MGRFRLCFAGGSGRTRCWTQRDGEGVRGSRLPAWLNSLGRWCPAELGKAGGSSLVTGQENLTGEIGEGPAKQAVRFSNLKLLR